MNRYYQFLLVPDTVTPAVYPVGYRYWHVNNLDAHGGPVYVMVTDMTPEEISYHWPHAFLIEELTEEPDLQDRPVKRHPTGEEKPVSRFRFKYPTDQHTGNVVVPGTYSLRQTTVYKYDIWTCCVESFEQLKKHWPLAWDISVIAEGMVV